MSAFLTVALIHFLVLVGPGPDFAIVIKNSLTLSRRSGVYTALGIALGVFVHLAYSMLGIGFVIARSILLFTTIKLLGAAYLMYIGWKALTSKASPKEDTIQRRTDTDIPRLKALQIGFLCNVLNPKVTLFFLALFTQVISPTTPAIVLILYGTWISTISFVWFTFIASIFSLATLKRRFERIQGFVERSMGAILIALGLRVALATRE